MIIKKTKIPIYDWNLKIYFFEKKDISKVEKIRENIKIKSEEVDKFFKNFIELCFDGGLYIGLDNMRSVILLYPFSNKRKENLVLIHELYHCISDISETLRLDSEEAEAYLLTFLIDKFINYENNS